ncbi:MAG: hypothetical protein DRI36_01680 [Caldiserica bacterium]|nr:MAG: hypothetical protein DRI36_01680 [Caldisericota bacterium]
MISTGSHLSIYAFIFSKIFKIPLILQEQNFLLSKSVRFLLPFSKYVFLGFPLKKKNKKFVLTGNPIIFPEKKLEKKEARRILGLENKKTILFYGGSQGSKFINNCFIEVEKELRDYQIIVIWGYYEIPEDLLKLSNRFIYRFRRDMDIVYQAVDFAVCRAGALTLTELIYYKIPSVLIPYPYAAKNHQLINALNFKKITGCEVIEEKYYSKVKLFSSLRRIEERKEEIIKRMGEFSFEERIKKIEEILC